MIRPLLSVLLATSLSTFAQKGPAPLTEYLTPDAPVKGNIVVVQPPDEIQPYLKKIMETAKTDPEWFRAYSLENAKSGEPLPYNEKLGISKADYDEYMRLWAKREMIAVPKGELVIRLEEKTSGKWMVRTTGMGTDITSLRYDAATDTFKSNSGTLERIKDVKTGKDNILGEWTGKEWKLEESDEFGVTKENFVIGKLVDESYGLMIHRVQELSLSGRKVHDKSIVIRFTVKRG